MESYNRIADDVVLGRDVGLHGLANLYGCTIGDESQVGTFVEIQRGAVVGARCKISTHAFICEGVTIEDEVFVGHHVCFTNDRFPRATRQDGELQRGGDWEVIPTLVRRRASIGSGALILPGLTVGEEAMVAGGAVVVEDVPPRCIVAGNPARVVREFEEGAVP